jgi:hypothetical protein
MLYYIRVAPTSGQASSSEILVLIYQVTRCHIPEQAVHSVTTAGQVPSWHCKAPTVYNIVFMEEMSSLRELWQ